MGSHHPFGHLKHKLWPKEGPRVKLAIWLPITKSWESPQFPYVWVTCNIPLKSSRRELQLFFKPHLNWRSAHKAIRPQSRRNPNFGNFETPIWESRDKKTIWMWASWRGTKYIIKGKVVAFPKFGPWWVLWVQICPWLILTPKVLQLCTNHLVLVLCRCVWVVDACHLS